MEILLYIIFFLSCIILIAAVLLQPGKTDAGALFTSNVSSSALAPRGTATVLSKITIIAATSFMLSALFLAMPALTGNISVLSANPDAPADAPASTDANSNTAAPDANAAVTNSNISASNANTAPESSNSALIETPATDEFKNKAANTAAPATKPAAPAKATPKK